MRGRKRKPVALHVLHGTYQPCRHGGRGPEPPDGSDGPPEPLEWMGERQREIWRETVADAPRGILHKIDRTILTLWVVTRDQHETAAAMQARLDAATPLPLLVKSGDGAPEVSPYVWVMNKSALLMVKLASELGFSPAARARLPIPPRLEADDDDSPWARFRVLRGGLDARRRGLDDELDRELEEDAVEGEPEGA